MVKLGELQLKADGVVVPDPSFLREVGGFNFFGEEALKGPFTSKYTVTVVSGTAHSTAQNPKPSPWLLD